VKLVRFTPTASVQDIRNNDTVKFMLNSNGFLDPYSVYCKIQVECADLSVNEVRRLDRSAHSFIHRLVIRSQGVELERIEEYDVMAAMVNDIMYSS
jgi:hypothetical protein